MSRTLTAQLRTQIDREVTLEGWVHRRRRLSAVTFLVLRDRSGLGQVVATDPRTRTVIDGLGEETVVRVSGTVAANAAAPGGAELTDPTIELLSDPAETPALELWRPRLNVSLPTLLDHAPIAWRHPRQRAVWQVAAASLRGYRAALDQRGFTEIATPKLVGSATESGADVFVVDYFGRPAYLAQSPQFYKQVMVGVFERVYEVGPVFRAEPHDTVRHLAEYVSLDAELGYIADHRDVVAVLRDSIAAMVDAIRETPSLAELAGARLPVVPAEFPIIHFSNALQMIGADPDEPDLAPEHERAIGQWGLDTFGSEFVVVEGYPAAKRPFYTHPQPTDPRWTNSFDLLFRGLELVTGGQRLHRYRDYEAALAARGSRALPIRDTCRPFATACPPMAVSPSAWNDGWRA